MKILRSLQSYFMKAGIGIEQAFAMIREDNEYDTIRV
jgi:hypothetical protein